MKKSISRRGFIKNSALAGGLGLLPISSLTLASDEEVKAQNNQYVRCGGYANVDLRKFYQEKK